MARKKTELEIVGIDELRATYGRIGKVAQTQVTKSARMGANFLNTKVKSTVTKTFSTGAKGNLRRGLVVKREKFRKKARADFQITFKADMNNIFVKQVQNPGIYGGDPRGRAYYPSSMEYGFKTKRGRWEGKHYLLNTADQYSETVKDRIMSILNRELKKLESKK